MASIYKVGKRWRVQIGAGDARQTKMFDTKAEASRWGMIAEAEGRKAPSVSMLISDALDRLEKILINEEKGRSEISRCRRIKLDPIARIKLGAVSKDDLIAYRDRRFNATPAVGDASVRREFNLIRGMFRRCREEWGWMNHNPFEGFATPQSPESRKRRIKPKEIKAIRHVFDVAENLNSRTITQRVGLTFLFAIETAMRSGEIVAMRWENVHLPEKYVHLPRSKNGDKRDVPLSPFAIEILEALPRDEGQPCFSMDDSQRDANWRIGRDRSGVEDLHFHDSRAEAIWRLSKKLDVLQLAKVIGHRDIRSLMIYYSESATELAAKLG